MFQLGRSMPILLWVRTRNTDGEIQTPISQILTFFHYAIHHGLAH